MGQVVDGALSPAADEELHRQLDRGEKLIWSGVPRQGVIFRASDLFLIPFSLMWGGFAIFWETSVVRSGAPQFLSLWGIPFVAIGLYLIFGRFFYDAFCRARTVYGLTGQRALILSGIWQRGTRSVYLEGLTTIDLTKSRSGRGTITLGLDQGGSTWGSYGWPSANRSLTPRFEGIAEPRRVLEMIRNAQKSLRRGQS